MVTFVLVVSTLEEEIPAIIAKINAEHDSLGRTPKTAIQGFEFESGTFAGKSSNSSALFFTLCFKICYNPSLLTYV